MRKARRVAGFSTEEMAERVGVSRSAVTAYELDRRSPKVPTLHRWADATETPFDWICLGERSTRWYSLFAA
jgi:transcriptional regulator with XRE-family HTH domain